MPSRLREYAGWCFQGYVLVHVLRRESSTRGWVAWLPPHWVGAEGGGFEETVLGGGGGGRGLR